MKLLGLKECINLTWVMIYGNDTKGYKNLRANYFEAEELEEEHDPKIIFLS